MRSRSHLVIFLAIAFGGAWLSAVPVWTSPRGLADPALALTLAGMQFSPTVGVLAVWLLTALRKDPAAAPRRWARDTGLTFGGRPGRALGFFAATWIGVPVAIALIVAVSALLGVFPTDLAGLSGYRQAYPQGNHTLALIGLLFGLVVLTPLSSIGGFCEEWGWRGYLLPRLLPLGYWRAMVVSGVIWGLWHAPLTLLGWSYLGLGAWAALPFTLFCVAVGAILGWLRLKTGSVWPAAIGHGALNAMMPVIYLIVADSKALPHPLLGGMFGAVGLAVFVLIAVTLARRSPITAPAEDIAAAVR